MVFKFVGQGMMPRLDCVLERPFQGSLHEEVELLRRAARNRIPGSIRREPAIGARARMTAEKFQMSVTVLIYKRR